MDTKEILDEWMRSEYDHALRRVTRWTRGCVHQAEDALQSALAKVVARVPSEELLRKHTEGELTGYILKAARNAAVDAYRRKKPTVALPDDVLLPECGRKTPCPPGQAEELFECLVPALDRLNLDQTVAVVLHLTEKAAIENMAPLLLRYLLRRTIRQWEKRTDVTRRSDLSRGLATLRRAGEE
jgi:DNA-directed RNA polymerase specialized sigma24 family protein